MVDKEREEWMERGAQAARQSGFRLPIGVTMDKREEQIGTVFYLRHDQLGDLGRLRVEERAVGSHFVCEVAGDPRDPQTRRRAEILEPIARGVGDVLASLGGPVPTGHPVTKPTPSSPSGGRGFHTSLFNCSKCAAPTAMLVFAPGARNAGTFADVARLMFEACVELGVPVWALGDPLLEDVRRGLGPDDVRSHIMQIWPACGDLATTTPDQFEHQMLVLSEAHCGKRKQPGR